MPAARARCFDNSAFTTGTTHVPHLGGAQTRPWWNPNPRLPVPWWTSSSQGSQEPGWHTWRQLCRPQLSTLSHTSVHFTLVAWLHFRISLQNRLRINSATKLSQRGDPTGEGPGVLNAQRQ